MDQLTKVHSISPVCFAGHPESRRESLHSDSRTGSQKRVHFDYRYTQDDFLDDRRTRKVECQSFDDWDNAGSPDREFRGRNQLSGSQGRKFSQRPGHSTNGSPQSVDQQMYWPQNFGQMFCGQPTYGPQNYGQVPAYGPQNYGPQNFAQPTPNYGPQQVPNYGPQNVVQPNYTIPVSQSAYTPPPLNTETGWNTGLTIQCATCGRAPHSHPNMCPAVNDIYHGCGLKGHFLHVCQTTPRQQRAPQSE